MIYCLWIKPGCEYTASRKVVCAGSIFCLHEGYRPVTPLDVVRVNRTIFHNLSVCTGTIKPAEGRYYCIIRSRWYYYMTRIEGGVSVHDMNSRWVEIIIHCTTRRISLHNSQICFSFMIYCLWIKPGCEYTASQKVVRAGSIFCLHEGYRSVTPLDVVRVNRTIFHNLSVCTDTIKPAEGRYYCIIYDIIIWPA